MNIANKKINRTAAVFAVLFAIFEIIGYSYARQDNWALALSTQNGGIYITLFALVGYTILFYICINAFFRLTEKEIQVKGEFSFGTEHPFAVSFCTLILLFTPYLIAFYPSIFMGDAFSNLCTYIEGTEYYMSAHVPVGYTALLWFFVKLGSSLFSNVNNGIFLYSILQLLTVIASISYANAVFVSVRKKWSLANWFILLFYFVTPLTHNYMFVMTKDILYAAYLLFMFAKVFSILYKEKATRSDYLVMFLLTVGTMMQRKDAPYILVFAFVITAIFSKKLRKVSFFMIGSALVLQLVMKVIILPVFGFEDGRTKEMLHIPIQQTVRTIVYHEAEFTEEERDVLQRAFVGYEELGDTYNPVQADRSKDHFVADLDSKLLGEYMGTWFKMFFKYPGSYLQATINNYYEYFYLGDKTFNLYRIGHSYDCMSNVSRNESVKELGLEYSSPDSLLNFRENYDSILYEMERLPILRLLSVPAFFVWGFLLMLALGITKRNGKVPAVLSLPLGVLCIALTTATNATYSRYEYPLVLLFPMIIAYALFVVKFEAKNK